MEDMRYLYDIKIEEISKYELVLLVARRAREINEMRMALEKKLNTKLIEKDKPTKIAMEEILSDKLLFEYRKPSVKLESEQPVRGMKKTI